MVKTADTEKVGKSSPTSYTRLGGPCLRHGAHRLTQESHCLRGARGGQNGRRVDHMGNNAGRLDTMVDTMVILIKRVSFE